MRVMLLLIVTVASVYFIPKLFSGCEEENLVKLRSQIEFFSNSGRHERAIAVAHKALRVSESRALIRSAPLRFTVEAA